MNKFFKNVLFYLLIIMVIIWMFDTYNEKEAKPAVEEKKYISIEG
mgnify:CR=1 FL=1